MTEGELLALADKVGGLSGPDRDKALDLLIAPHLGWSERKVTALGLKGRTPGRLLWFFYPAPWGSKGKPLPNLTGPRKRVATAQALRALATPINTVEEGVDHGCFGDG